MAQQLATATPVLTPPAGTWDVDPAHSNVEFVVRHMFTSMRGRFGEFSGVIEVGATPEESKVEGTIAAASIDTRVPDRDDHLRSPDFLDVENHPLLSFRSTSVRTSGNGRLEVDGELTIRGVTRPVTLDVEFLGSASDPWGGERASFSARTELDREDFGLTWNAPLAAGGVLVGRRVRIELEVEAVRRPA